MVPYDPNNSFLLMKLMGVPLHGAQMPMGKAPWPDSAVKRVSDWIQAGANHEPFNCVEAEGAP